MSEPPSPELGEPITALGSAWPGEDLASVLRETLRTGHLANADQSIAGVGDDGAFVDPLLWGTAGPPVVVDANWLHDDLLRFCRTQKQTIMLTAANSGLLRLYCAEHVLDEVVEHHEEWAQAKGLSAADVLHSWQRNYLPLLRWVDPPSGLLTADEQARIDVLHGRDSDDVPSATLALLLQAALISRDKHPTAAVYGSGTVVRRQAELLELFRVAGDMVQLRQLAKTAAFVPFASGSALLQAAAKAAKASPALALLATGAAGFLLLGRHPRERVRRVGGAAGRSIGFAAQLIAVHQAWQDSMEAAAPAPVNWEHLPSHIPAELALTRALMWTLAHAGQSQMTVAELVAALPPLPFGHSERPTRSALRSQGSTVFQEFLRGALAAWAHPTAHRRSSDVGLKTAGPADSRSACGRLDARSAP